jgi:hypothetical protein
MAEKKRCEGEDPSSKDKKAAMTTRESARRDRQRGRVGESEGARRDQTARNPNGTNSKATEETEAASLTFSSPPPPLQHNGVMRGREGEISDRPML